MVDFVTLLAAKDIIKHLDSFNVPGENLTWDRVLNFAKNYNTFTEPMKSVDVSDFVLSEDQLFAWIKLQNWVTTKEPYFVLRGYAGTGKTHLLKMLKTLDLTLMFTAPTNKATKVLSKAVKNKAATTYSALGITMSQDEDKLTLKFSPSPPYIPRDCILVVDECGMIGGQLFDFIEQTRRRTGCKILYIGDPAQLQPIGEMRSKTWQVTSDINCKAFLKKVMRYDNDLLKLATDIRQSIKDKTYDKTITSSNNGTEGVFIFKNLDVKINKYDRPSDWLNRKVIAWRNKTVDRYNNQIRGNFGFTERYQNGDIILAAEPIQDNGVIVATIDEEFTIKEVHKDVRKVYHDQEDFEIPVWRLDVAGDTDLTLYVPVNDSDLNRILAEKAHVAKECRNRAERKEAWKDFWDTKALFNKVRYGYAITAHRAQGSTYETVMVDQQDILANSNEVEAMRCLYVSVTRASTNVYSF